MISVQDTSTPVVLLRSIRHSGVGLTRSLGRLGIAVHSIEAERRAPVFSSRYCAGRVVWDLEHAPAEESLRLLADVGRRLGRRALLVPTTDAAAMFVADHADDLREQYLFPDQPAGLVRSLCSKESMYYLAKRAGIPTPDCAFPKSRADVRAFLHTARFPVMLKGIFGRELKIRAGQRMFIVRTADELLEHYDRLEDPDRPNLMIQEYIPGGEDTIWMFNGYFDRQSECLIGFTGRKIRQCPAYTGPTSLGVCLRNDTVARQTRTLVKALGYRGVLDIGYRYDARDGRFKVLDVNPRIGHTFRLFVARNGMDVARALYLDLTGQPVPASEPREGRKWIVEDCDLFSSLRYRRDGRLTVREWLRSLRGIEEGGYAALDDPLPAASICLVDLRLICGRLLGALRG
jgi:predicted ATP-grasp superfamily ATP-dependent carboligase